MDGVTLDIENIPSVNLNVTNEGAEILNIVNSEINIIGATSVGPPGPTGVVNAITPLSYDVGTRTLTIAVGNTAGTVAAGDDPRLTDQRIFISSTQPTGVTGAYLWIQTSPGTGTDTEDFSFWIEDGS